MIQTSKPKKNEEGKKWSKSFLNFEWLDLLPCHISAILKGISIKFLKQKYNLIESGPLELDVKIPYKANWKM